MPVPGGEVVPDMGAYMAPMCAVAIGLAASLAAQFLAPDVYQDMVVWTGSVLEGPMLYLALFATNAALFAVLWYMVRRRRIAEMR